MAMEETKKSASNNPDRNIIFFFGAGVSIPAGMPQTQEITDQVLSGKGIVRHTDDSYHFGRFVWEEYGFKEEYVWRVQECLKYFGVLASRYYSDWHGRPTSYEDLYYMASQVYDALLYEYDNPALQPTLDDARENLTHLLQHRKGEPPIVKWKFEDLFAETTKYIVDVLWRLLGRRPRRVDFLQLIAEAYYDKGIDQIDVCTLNHDFVLEEFCRAKSIPVNDGFVSEGGRLWEWNADELSRHDNRLRLLKLHGSVDWFYFQRTVEGRLHSFIAKVSRESCFERLPIPGYDPLPVPNHPVILVGTYNKILEYQREIFFNLQVHFSECLRGCNRVFISGYSFRDRAVNMRIINWMNNDPERCITIAHRDPEILRKSAGPIISEILDRWLKDGRLTVIPRWIEDVRWRDLEQSFERMSS